MAKNYANQIEYTGQGYLDAKMQPVATLADLPTSRKKIANGQTITVLNDGEGKGPRDYWFINNAWTLKNPDMPKNIDCGEY